MLNCGLWWSETKEKEELNLRNFEGKKYTGFYKDKLTTEEEKEKSKMTTFAGKV